MTSGNFGVEVRTENGAPLLSVRGELDLATSPALEEQLEQVAATAPPLIIIDLRELDFMDSTGLSVLIRAHQRAQIARQELVIVNGSRQVRRLLSLTGVAERLRIVEDPSEVTQAP